MAEAQHKWRGTSCQDSQRPTLQQTARWKDCTHHLQQDMDKQNSKVFSLKSSQTAGQQKPLSYSVETPYGFHLDLDFLKYVNDIEQGNTIRRVPMHRKNKGPKFRTLSRNFSLPAHSFQFVSQTDVWALPVTFGPAAKTQVTDTQQIFGFQACDIGVVDYCKTPGTGHTSGKAVEDVSIKAFNEQPLGFHVRPHLLRASSMPATIFQRKNSEMDDPELQSANEANGEDGSSEDVYCSNDTKDKVTVHQVNINLHQELNAALQRIRNLEEEVKTIPKLKAQINTLKEEKEQCQLRKSQSTLHVEPQTADSQQPGSDSQETSSTADTVKKQLALQSFQGNNQQTTTQQQASRALNVALKGSLMETSKQVEEVKNFSVLDQYEDEKGDSMPLNVDEDTTHQAPTFKSALTSSDHEAVTIIALQAKLMALEQKYGESKMDLDRINALLTEQMLQNKLLEEKLKQNVGGIMETDEGDQETCSSAQPKSSPDYGYSFEPSVNMCHEQKSSFTESISVNEKLCLTSTHFSSDSELKGLTSTSTQTYDVMVEEAEISLNVQETKKFVEAVVVCNTATRTDFKEAKGFVAVPLEAGSQHNVNSKCEKQTGSEAGDESQCEQRHLGQETSPWEEMDTSAIGHLVTQIESLLQKQWTYLESGVPESTAQVSIIQSQLVNTLHKLSSLCLAPGQEARDTQKAALKSIMKKNAQSTEHSGSTGTKKNLKFVGVNGGYETTSSEDSSEEDNMEADNTRPEKEKEDSDNEDEVAKYAEEFPGPTVESPVEQPCWGVVGEEFMAACHLLKDHLAELESPSDEMRKVLTLLYQEWFLITSRKESQADVVALHLCWMGAATTPDVLRFVVNVADGNGNMALHYSASHGNFDIVKLLLDTDLCEVDHQNKAGYTAIMLASLAAAECPEDMGVATQLMKHGHVDTRASQTGQTALMLAASHGRSAMVHLLLECGANPNVQDYSGSTALICACEHGHTDVVCLLLNHSECDAKLTNREGRSALSVATTAAYMEIVDLLHAHMDAGASDTGGGL
ncbi:KN motif and ankyrin repeat domain-containing protein 4-like [Arapaima gigas]